MRLTRLSLLSAEPFPSATEEASAVAAGVSRSFRPSPRSADSPTSVLRTASSSDEEKARPGQGKASQFVGWSVHAPATQEPTELTEAASSPEPAGQPCSFQPLLSRPLRLRVEGQRERDARLQQRSSVLDGARDHTARWTSACRPKLSGCSLGDDGLRLGRQGPRHGKDISASGGSEAGMGQTSGGTVARQQGRTSRSDSECIVYTRES